MAPLVLWCLCLQAQDGPAEARDRYRRGLRLLHSFEYDDARREFAAARKLAPGFAMAAWGEAMTYNEPLWQAQNRELGRAALQHAPAGAGPRERDYLAAAAVLYGEGTKEQRDRDYAEAMRRLSEKYPQDVDAAAFYALAMLGTCHRGRDFRVYMQAAAILEDAFRRQPDHPGVLHYLIHCYDDPIHAPLGLRAARSYAKIAAEAPHALHMPSHIFIALGSWDEMVASNEASSAAAHGRSGGYHSLWWLEYGYLQQGRFQDARRLLQTMEQETKKNRSPMMRFHLAEMLAHFRIETGEPYPITPPLDTSDLDLPAIAADLLGAGIVAMNRGWRAEAERCLGGLRKIQARGAAYPGDAQATEIAARELSALLQAADGKSKEAMADAAEAAKIEDAMSFEPGPPVPPKPAHELYGEILLQLGRAKEARDQFDLALARAPKRALSLLGLARALTQMGDKLAAERVYGEIEAMWTRADQSLRKALKNNPQMNTDGHR